MSFKDCIAEINRAVGRDITDEQGDVFENVQRIIEKHKLEGRLDDVQKSVTAYANEIKAAAVIEKKGAVLNKIRKLEMLDYVSTTWADDIGTGFEAYLAGAVKGARRGSRDSVATSQGNLFAKHAMGLVADLEEMGLHQVFVSGELDLDIWRAMHQLDADTPNMEGLGSQAVNIAKTIQKHNESLRLLANDYGANIQKLTGYMIKQTHDQGKIYRDKTGWFDYMNKKLDWEKSFDDVFTDAERTQVLEDLYTDFAAGVHLSAPKGAPSGFKGFGNIGKKMSHQRVLHFKDADAEYGYHQKYGSGKMTQGVIYGMEKMAQDIGILRHLGPNAEANLEEVMQQMLAKVRQEHDPKKFKRVERELTRVMKNLWPHVSGLTKVPGNHMLADASQMVRNVQTWAKLGGAVLSGISDVPLYGSEVRYQGGTMLGGMAEAVGSLAKSVPKKDQARLMSSLSVMYDGMISATTKRFDASDSVPGRMSAITNIFFKFNGLRWWTDKLRTGFARSRSVDLASQAGKSWKGVPKDLQRALSLYGIDEAKWTVLQKAVDVGDDGRSYMTPEGIANASDEVVGKLIDKPTPAKIRRMRQEIEDQFRSYFYDRASTAALEPDVKTQAYMLRGTQSGTVEGEFLRHIMLFKSFTAAVVQKPLAREIYGRGANSLGEALKNGNGEMSGLASLLAWNIAFGYLSMTAKDLAKGRSPRDPSDYKTFLASAAQGGGFGIYGDFLFGDMKNRYGGGALSTLMGPTAGTLSSLIDIGQRMRDGDDAAAQTFRVLVNNTPFVNLFYTRWALDYMVLNRISENLSPGYLQRQEQRMMDQNGQTFLVPPVG